MRVWLRAVASLLIVVMIAATALDAQMSSDVTPPTFVSMSVSPTTVQAGGTVTVTARITDAETGVSTTFGGLPEVIYQNATGGNDVGPITLTRVSGTAQDGVYQGTATVPAVTMNGQRTVQALAAYDAIGNRAFVEPPQPPTADGVFTVVDAATPTATPTSTPTATSTPTETPTVTPTVTHAATSTPSPTPTATATGTSRQTPTATVSPSATPLPPATPAPPDIAVSVSRAEPNRLLVTLSARSGQSIERLDWTLPPNAAAEALDGQPLPSGLIVPAGIRVSAVSFYLLRTGGSSVTLPITVTGSFGTWRTFVGGGPNAW